MSNGYQATFERFEKKYLLSSRQYKEFRKRTAARLVTDEYGKSTICNIYFDTPDARLIRTSLEKPVYKEKLRLRSYGTPGKDQPVFVELKKKYKGVVYKRRESMMLSEAEAYLLHRERPGFESQVIREIDWFMRYYDSIEPAMYISYERIAQYDTRNPALRVTFDSDICWREEELDLRKGAWGQPVLDAGQCLMEIKIPGAMPLWLGDILDELHIYPVSFSKYGRAYRASALESKSARGGVHCA